MSRSPVRVSEPPRPRTQAAAAWLVPPDPRKIPYTVCGTFRTHISCASRSTPTAASSACTITDPGVLEEQASATRARGYASQDGEYRDGVRPVAAPVRDPAGGDRRARRPRRHGRSADPERIRYRDTAPVLGRIRASWTRDAGFLAKEQSWRTAWRTRSLLSWTKTSSRPAPPRCMVAVA
jgi:hypothetical protein